MKFGNAAIIVTTALLSSLPCFAENENLSQQATSQSAPMVLSQNEDFVARQIMLSLSQPNRGVRSFVRTANNKTLETTPQSPDPLKPLNPAAGLAPVNKAKVPAKTKAAPHALPQLRTAAKKGGLL